MSRTQLLGAASAAVLACFTTGSHAASVINGGGSTLAQFDYIGEFSAYNGAVTGTNATFGSYWEAGSTSGQNAFLYDDLSCDINKVNNLNGKHCTGSTGSGPGTTGGVAGNTVVYGASDATLDNAQAPFSSGDASQLAFWATESFGQALSGGLIQLPSMGIGVSFPVVDAGFTTNGQASLSDSDLCEIFSGGYTDFSQITDAVTAARKHTVFQPGAFKVVYRSDGSGTSFILLDHLAAVCTSSNTAAGVTFSATTSFVSIFGSAGAPANFVGQSGSGGIAGYMEPATGTGPTSIGYLSPDFTSLDPNSFATVNGAPSTLVVASVLNKTLPELPTTTNITTALKKAVTGYYLTAPTTATAGANPANWVPLVQVASAGYPIVGYTTFDFAQCYADKTITASVIAFLKAHYLAGSTEQTDQTDNGFVPIANAGAATFSKAIGFHFLANVANAANPAWNLNFGNTSLCQANGAPKNANTYVGR